jgi:hypothetical protein
MTQWPKGLQKTRYEDINEFLLKSYYMRQEIEDVLAFNPDDDIVFYEGYLWRKMKM